MAPIDERTLFLWMGIVALVILTSVTGMLLNRYLTYRAHRKALQALRTDRVARNA